MDLIKAVERILDEWEWNILAVEEECLNFDVKMAGLLRMGAIGSHGSEYARVLVFLAARPSKREMKRLQGLVDLAEQTASFAGRFHLQSGGLFWRVDLFPSSDETALEESLANLFNCAACDLGRIDVFLGSPSRQKASVTVANAYAMGVTVGEA
jgi:hypothetical protein